jgi:hypothetical protein
VFYKAIRNVQMHQSVVSGSDACLKAADIYQCGQEKDPALVLALRGKLTDNSPAAKVYLKFMLSLKS